MAFARGGLIVVWVSALVVAGCAANAPEVGQSDRGVCTGPPFRIEPPYDPPGQGVNYHAGYKLWRSAVEPARDPAGQPTQTPITRGPYPVPFAVCSENANDPVYVVNPKNSDGPAQWDGSHVHRLRGGCMIGRLPRAVVQTSPTDNSHGATFRYWSHCSDGDTERTYVGERIQWAVPDFPTSIQPLDSSVPFRVVPGGSYQTVLASQPSPMVVQICVGPNVYVVYTDDYDPPAAALPNLTRYLADGQCHTVQARTIFVLDNGASGYQLQGGIRVLSVPQ